MISACGLHCDTCRFFNNECKGCHAVQGSTFWAIEMMPDAKCPLYKCGVVDKQLKHCGQCPEIPCEKFLSMKDPDSTDLEHENGIKERVAILQSLKKEI